MSGNYNQNDEDGEQIYFFIMYWDGKEVRIFMPVPEGKFNDNLAPRFDQSAIDNAIREIFNLAPNIKHKM